MQRSSQESVDEFDDLKNVVGTFPRGFSRNTSFAYPLVRADSLVTLNYGKGLVEKNRVPGIIPVYGTNGQCGWHNEGLVKGPGVILGRKGMGPLGVEWCESDFWVIDTAYYVTPNTPKLDLKFFYYLVKYIGLNHLKDGTSNPSLSRDTFSAQLLPFPPLDEQMAIAHILGTLDDKIELNQQMNRTLEAIARALFKSWFIDFDPVRAKMDGRQPVGMDAETAALFPDEFEDSAISKIPKDWKVGTLADIATFRNGKSISPSVYTEQGKNPVFGSNGQIALTDELLNSEPVIVVGRVGAYCGSIHRVDVPSWVTDNAIVVEAKPNSDFDFLYYCLRTLNLSHTAIGSAQPLVTQSGLKVIRTVIPPKSIVHRFGAIIHTSSQQNFFNIKQAQTLALIRDTLLPKLLSGEIRIKEAEKIVAEVA